VQKIPTALVGAFELQLRKAEDRRGAFVKTIQRSVFEQLGFETKFVEQYYTVSQTNVLRGMHFQTPPDDHAKLVYCPHGKALDVLLDIRRGSPTFGLFATIELSAEKANAVYVPRGLAHGFYAVEGPLTMVYNVTSEHSPKHDAGIAWNSFGAPWPSTSPIISDRDAGFPTLSAFETPFVFEG
jgi:dTDP-4-dehydrorhamnose 3,5-epimerase